jgi:hypothetical protein
MGSGGGEQADYFEAIDNEPGMPRTTVFCGGRARVDPAKTYLGPGDLGDGIKLGDFDRGAGEVVEAFLQSPRLNGYFSRLRLLLPHGLMSSHAHKTFR